MQPPARPDRRRHGPPAGRQPHLVGGLGRPQPCWTRCRRTSARSWSSGSPRSWTRSPRTIRKRLVTCGDPGSVTGTCWNGSPYQPVPVATDVAQGIALRILEQPEDYPSVVAERQSVRAYPHPYGVNLAHVLGYLSPITDEGVRPGPEGRRPLASTAPPRSAGPASRSSTTRGCAACPATSGWRSTRWAACSVTTARSTGSRATPWSPRSTPRSRAWSRGSSRRPSSSPGRPTTRSPT